MKAFNKAFSLKSSNHDDLLAKNLSNDPNEVYRILQYEITPKNAAISL